jgi:hypothetical protein
MERRGAIRGAIAGMLIALGFAIVGWGEASSLASESATPILVVDGKTADGKPTAFDLALLKTLPAITLTTATPWSEGENQFEGVRLRDLLERLGGRGTAVIASAVDEYHIAIPMADIEDYDVIVAYGMNSQPLPPDDKGPLWIIYPFSAHSGLQKDLYFSRSVWQLNRLTVQ